MIASNTLDIVCSIPEPAQSSRSLWRRGTKSTELSETGGVGREIAGYEYKAV
jgi:hypothetical protein